MKKQDILQVLIDTFGYDSFRDHQESIIHTCLNQDDCVVLMPTGGGKSLCYQIPALIQPGCAVIISPLISLMQDQVLALQELGVCAQFWNSTLNSDQVRHVVQLFQQSKLKLLYIAPERLMADGFIEFLKTGSVSLFAIDEAHCISEWGHDFRPDYRHLSQIRQQFPTKPIMALTATATPKVLSDIQTQLSFSSSNCFQASFDRHNLYYEIRPKKNTVEQIFRFLKDQPDNPGIIYCQSRKQVERLTERLNSKGFSALPYHAGLPDKDRHANQQAFIHDKTQIIVATIAFGMGINKSNVRFVIHYDLPKTIENYYQETGRAGRDGLPSHCLLFYTYADKQKYEGFFKEISDPKERQQAFLKLSYMTRFAYQSICRRKQLLQYFGEDYTQKNCKTCDICVHPPEQFDATVISQKILSCIYRVKQRFGSGVIMAVLRGDSHDQIKRYGLEKLSVYGIETEMSVVHMRDVIHYLHYLEYIRVSDDDYSILSLTEKAVPVLKGQETVMMPRLAAIKAGKGKRGKKSPGSGADDSVAIADQSLFEQLKQKRRELADERGIPPYIIFHDSTLKEIALTRPQSLKDFAGIHGVGKKKLETLAVYFLEIVKENSRSDLL